MKIIFAVAAALLLAACQSVPEGPTLASAQLKSTRADKKVFGEATFEQVGDKVKVFVTMQGLKPGQQHGLHIHEGGDCGNGGMNAKGHFNPYGKPHGHYSSAERHAGDLPALNPPAKRNKRGRAHLNAEVDIITVTSGPASIIGRTVIVHAQPDDYRSQPTGNAGGRIACGVIRAH